MKISVLSAAILIIAPAIAIAAPQGSYDVKPYDDYKQDDYQKCPKKYAVDYKKKDDYDVDWKKDAYKKYDTQYVPKKYEESVTGDRYDYSDYKPKFKLRCPKLSKCKAFKNIPDLSFQLVGPSIQAICVFGSNENTCSLAPLTGSFCRLNGEFFGPDQVEVDESGQAFVKCPRKKYDDYSDYEN